KLADEASLSAPVPAPDQLAALVDGTTDQLSLRPEVVPSAAFDALLAEAEAALSLDTVPAAEPPVAQPPAPAVVVSAAFAPLDTPAAENADAHPSGPGRIPGLRDRLRVLGVPECYLPQGEEPSIDALARSLGTLPEAPPLPAQPGAVVLLVSAEPLLERSVETLLGALGLGRRDVVRCDVDSLATDEADARRAETVRVRAAVRVARRRATGSTTLVGLSSGARKAEPAAVAEMIDCIRPDYVLAAVDASTKRADAVPWFEGLGAVNAAAVWGLDDTRTPGELLGALPVSFADGKACSAVSWTAALLARVADELA
ncbi:MAG TPA: hypothetical protein VEG62_07410, partial [Acidimicrobiales bacterium]|nr:hypothetical protein [Acidimicrobiales bacterium]